MKILYVAAGIPVPGALGGSTHAYEVARGLAQRGHAVHLVAASREGWAGVPGFARPVSRRLAGFWLHQVDLPKALSLLAVRPVFGLAQAVRPDVVIERYYNFAGLGLIAARRLRIPALLEVNALIVDPPAVTKRRLDDALGGPMRRWAEWQCRAATALVTPLHTTVPPSIDRSKIVELPWGADVERFAAVAAQRAHPQTAPQQVPNVVFMGSFRAWHGVTAFVRAALRLLDQGQRARFTLIGSGPEHASASALVAASPHAPHFAFTGAVPYDQIPALLAQATLGVAPFDSAAHPALRAAGFFWSPLKIYEYMAAGLPVVTTAIPPLDRIIRHEREGLLFQEGSLESLAAAIARLLADPAAAWSMGQAARARVVAHYSWQQHCADLERVLGSLSFR